LINETESILETEKKKLEEIERRGQEKLKVLEQLKITYKLTQGGKDAWKNVPILIEEKQHRSKSIHGSIVTIEDERIKLKIRIRHLEEEKKGLETRIEQLEPLESEKTNLKLIINDKDKEIKSLQDDITVHQSEKRKLKSQIKQKNVKIDTLDDEITELNVKTSQLNLQVQDKDKKIKSVQTDNRKLKKEKAALGQELKEKGKRISSIENEKAILHTAAIKQAQKLETLHHEKTSLEMVLKSKVDALTVLNGENKNLSAANQIINGLLGSKQNELESQTSQAESVKQNLEQQLANEKRKNEALEREMRLLREAQIESAFYNSVSQPVESTYYDDVSQNDINYDTEFGEESDDDNTPPVDIAPVVRRWPIWIKQINE
jgi:chromosome segregation ATPase